jgi:hypothetical protein
MHNISDILKLNKLEKYFFLIFIITIISGALRKWIFVSSFYGLIIFVIQILFPFILFLFHNKNRSIWDFPILRLYVIYLFFCAFNPLNLTFYHGAVGIILHFSFWILISFYFINREVINFQLLIPLFLHIIFLEILLAFIQYQLPNNHWLNTYANTESIGDIAMVGNSVRATGTFSYVSGFSAFVIFIIFFVWFLIRVQYNKSIIIIIYLGGVLASFMSGSRQSTGVYFIISLLILYSEIDLIKKFKLFSLIILLLVISSFVYFGDIDFEISNKIEVIYTNFIERRNSNFESGEESKRIFWDLNDIISFRGNYPIFGIGLGSTYQGFSSLFGISDYLKEFGYYENELTRIVLEGGFVLFIFRISLLIFFLSLLKINLLSKIVLFIIIFYFTPFVFNIYMSIFLAFGLMILDNSSMIDSK